ncbi:MAG: nucleotidyltransferase family protein [Prevotellaceae bacterium]|jgi:NDP-sugar pyrophosphorylase family protein|nr:nucleotidyltransferase family protein [Prevotellaceae bacterium]
MKAMILAAGLGTRLAPLTDTRPKALVMLKGKTLLETVVQKLIAYRFNEIIINVHHFAGQIKDFLDAHQNFGIRIAVSDESGQLLDTGGGIKKAAWFFDDGQPFLVHNVDIISNINLAWLYESHLASEAAVTLACSVRESSRCFLFDNQQRLCGWKNKKTGEQKITVASAHPLTPMAFNGIHVINPPVTGKLPQGAFSIVDAYLKLAPEAVIKAFDASNYSVVDVGKSAQGLPFTSENYKTE